MYSIVAFISFLIRQYVLPNPFDPLGVVWAYIINGLTEPLLHYITFGLVGTGYDSGDCPPLGAFLYLVVRIVLTAILYGISWLIAYFFL